MTWSTADNSEYNDQASVVSQCIRKRKGPEPPDPPWNDLMSPNTLYAQEVVNHGYSCNKKVKRNLICDYFVAGWLGSKYEVLTQLSHAYPILKEKFNVKTVGHKQWVDPTIIDILIRLEAYDAINTVIIPMMIQKFINKTYNDVYIANTIHNMLSRVGPANPTQIVAMIYENGQYMIVKYNTCTTEMTLIYAPIQGIPLKFTVNTTRLHRILWAVVRIWTITPTYRRLRNVYDIRCLPQCPTELPTSITTIKNNITGLNNSMAMVVICRKIIANEAVLQVIWTEIRALKLKYFKYMMVEDLITSPLYQEIIKSEVEIKDPTKCLSERVHSPEVWRDGSITSWLVTKSEDESNLNSNLNLS
jgi:hypothetical protein